MFLETRHFSDDVVHDRVIKYQLRKNIADIEIKDGTKSKEYQEEVLNEYIPKALKTIKVLEEKERDSYVF